MAIITISRGTFSGGEQLTECLAKRLGYIPVSREILLKSAAIYGLTEEKLKNALEGKISLKERLAINTDRFRYLSFIQSSLCEEAKKDNIIYYGHAGHLLLKGVSHVLKVKIIAGIEQRIVFAMERNKLTKEQAIRYIEDIDKQRAKWTKFLYDVDWNDPSLYDFVVNINKITIPAACEMISVLANSKAFQATEASIKVINNLALASKVRAVLAANELTQNCNVNVVAEDGIVTVSGKVESMEDAENIEELVKNTEGVKGMSCQCHPNYLKDVVL